MEKLRVPLWVTAIYILLVGLSALSPSVVSRVYGYAVKDTGVLLILAAALLGFGVVLWGIASNPDRYSGLASLVVISLVIFIVALLWGLVRNVYTARNVAIPLIIDIVLGAWIWSARPKS